MRVHTAKKRKLTAQGDHDYPNANGRTATEVAAAESDEIEDEDEDDENGDEDVNDSGDHAKQPRPRLPGRPKERSRPKVAEAVSRGSYTSGLLELQVDELLADVRHEHNRKRDRIDTLVRKLKGVIESIPEREELSIEEAERSLRDSHGVAVPFPQPRPGEGARYKLAYLRPVTINIVGSYAFGSITSDHGTLAIDMAVTMPSSTFQEKDYLNYRYFHKRAYYLACLAAGVEESDVVKFKTSFEALNGNDLHPILRLELPTGGDGTEHSDLRFIVKVQPIVSDDVFPPSKLSPSRNCVRLSEGANSGPSQELTPTPFYNASLRADCTVNLYLKFLHSTSLQCEAFKDACILGRLWLRQRGFGGSVDKGGFGHFEWGVLMALLLHGSGPKDHRVLSSGYSSYQLFKAMLQFLSLRDLITDPFILQGRDIKIPKGSGPVVFDGARSHNVLFKMTLWSYQLLRHEVSTGLKMLNDARSENFEASFIMKVDRPLVRFDLVARIPMAKLPPLSFDHESESMRLSQKIFSVLSKGLGDRAHVISPMPQRTSTWSTKPRSSGAPEITAVEVRFLLNPATAGRIVDHGPSAENKKEAAAFRKFWGEKAELRRFKDGSILESVVWLSGSMEQPIIQQIICYLLERHIFSGSLQSIEFVGDIVREMLPKGLMSTSQPLALFQPFMTLYDDLEKSIRELEGLPLQVRHLAPASPSLRYTSLVPARGRDQISSSPADVVIQFEGSGRWPDDLIAIQRTKIALLLKIGQLLMELKEGVVARVGLENESYKTLNSSFLDIIYGEAAFRLHIQNEREQTLIERQLNDKSLDPRSRDEAVLALAAYKRAFIQAPAHTQAIRLLCTRFPLLSPTIILVKRWFNSHMLFPHFSDEFIELLVIRMYVQPFPWQAPSSVTSGFLRTLFFLSRWDWRIDPLIVDINGEINAKDIETITTRFEAWKKIDPGMSRMVLFAASKLDPDGVTWTQSGPSKVVAARMTTLARSACSVMNEAGLNLDPAILFTSSTTDYDFLIHLHPRFTAGRRGEKEKRQEFKNLPVHRSSEDVELVGYNPVQLFLNELKSLYTSNILFFHNPESGTTIAGIWNPNTGPRAWKVNLTYSTKPIISDSEEAHHHHHPHTTTDGDSPGLLDINKPAILNEIARLGGDMVLKLEVLRS